MLIAKLTISYDRGLARNDENDLLENGDVIQSAVGVKVLGRGQKTASGKIIRGLGTHFASELDAQLVGERDKEARRIYKAFRERFLTLPIDGLYAVPAPGIAKAFVRELQPQLGIQVRVSEFQIATNGDLDAAEIKEWSDKIKRQLQTVSLGRKAEIDDNGLSALATLASCPLIAEATKKKVLELVEGARCQKIERVELKRALDVLDVKIDQTMIHPRRMPSLVEA